MRAIVLGLFMLAAGVAYGAQAKGLAEVAREGDIVFQSTRSPQSLAIALATKSAYTHCGVVLEKKGRLYVFEAIRTVSWTPLEDWVQRGAKGHYVLMRPKQALDQEALAALRNGAERFVGKEYDLLFQWSDAQMYCSELVWKLYRQAGVELCGLRRFRDFDLDHEEVRNIVRQRYGKDLPPLDEQVIAPSDLMRCGVLERVGEN